MLNNSALRKNLLGFRNPTGLKHTSPDFLRRYDIGDVLAPYTHSEMVAAILRPYMSEKTCWIVKHHGLFQMYYYAHHYGEDRHAHDRFKDHPWYDDCAEFCEKYDQNCFDPTYDSLPIEFFEPMVRKIFTAEAHID